MYIYIVITSNYIHLHRRRQHSDWHIDHVDQYRRNAEGTGRSKASSLVEDP